MFKFLKFNNIAEFATLVFLVPAMASASCEEAYDQSIEAYTVEKHAVRAVSTTAFVTGHPVLSSTTSTTAGVVGTHLDDMVAAKTVIEEAKNGDGIGLREFQKRYGWIVGLDLQETRAAILEGNERNIFCTPDAMTIDEIGQTVQVIFGKTAVR